MTEGPATLPASGDGQHASPARTLSLIDCIGIGINGIIGSGIYLLIAPMARVAGPASVVGTLSCGALCILIALCFAELTGMYDRNGGAYIYAREAFGPHVGFAVGWMSLATSVLAFAAVASGFGEAVAAWVPAVGQPALALGGLVVTGKSLVAMVLIAVLGIINFLGAKAGARISDFLSFAKLAPLLVIAAVGAFSIRGDVLTGMFSSASLPTGPGAASTWGSAVASSAFIAVFMLSGFEYMAVPAGEAKEARRNIPRSILGSLIGSTLLYCVLQLIAASVVSDVGSSTQPLIDSAQAIFGSVGAKVLGVAALISMAGFCAGSALVGPRYFMALAEDGYLPQRLSAVGRHRTPGAAILTSTVLAMGLALSLGYASLVDVSNVALFAQYVPTVIAVAVLRWTQPDAPRTYRLPGGPTIPVFAAAGSVWLLWTASPPAAEWIFSGQLLVAGAVIWMLTGLARRMARSRGGLAEATAARRMR